MNQELEDSLVGFFKKTTVSSAIIRTFSRKDEAFSFGELVEGVNLLLEGHIPEYATEGAVRSSLRLLKESGWVIKKSDGFVLTDLGRELARRIG